MIVLCYAPSYSTYDSLVQSCSNVEDVHHLEYLNGELILDGGLIKRLKSKKVVILVDNIHLNFPKLEAYAKLKLAGVQFGAV